MIIATLCAFFVKGMCGFANTLVFTTILSYSIDNINISPMELLLGYPANVIIAWKERKSVEIKKWLPLTVLVIGGSIPGMLFLKNGNTKYIKILFGIVVVCIGLEMLVREYQIHKHKGSKILLGIIGVISGLLCGLYGVGALLAAYMSRTTENTTSFRGNLCMVFIVENTFRVIMYTTMGIITGEIVIQVIKLIPIMLLGLYLGMKCASIVPEKIVKKIVILMLVISGIALIINNI